jgi:hypothetical protein
MEFIYLFIYLFWWTGAKICTQKEKRSFKKYILSQIVENLAKFDHTTPKKKGFCQIYTGS